MLEDARRMGVDASVPSNTLDDQTAAKIREMYYPKKKEVVAAKPTARLIKHLPTAAAPALEKTPEATEPAPSPTPEVVETKSKKAAEVSAPAAPTTVIKQLARPVPVATKPQPAPAPENKAENKAKAQPAEPQARLEHVEADSNKPRLVKPPAPTKTEPAMEQPPLAEEKTRPEEIQAKMESAPESIEQAPASEPQVIEIASPATVAEIARKTKLEEPPAVRPTVHKSQHKPASPVTPGTKVIKLAMPTMPLPKPSPTTSARFQTEKPKTTGRLDPSMLLKKDQPREGKDKETHILPSGAQQRTVYIPPKDQKPKGRHQHRAKDKEKDKFQDGNTHR
ncbi:MAG: hypothetical protein ACRD82_23065, partial [Blastocatellia bacterium]